ncbi:electron transport complex subunit RsxG [Stutzerimonas stutzeri]|uniref:electron transport complex subunit RsxG n=1 Tax=Stutzerimonas stutzeri TaxID=316 RepID=UPI001CFDCC93|nr:electron transport complex subunit RsxG [Stutzerimonas stutzeri]
MNEMTQVPPAESGSEPSAVRPGLIEAWRDRVAYQALSLGLVCALVAVVLLLGNQLTRQRIVDAELQDRLAVLRQVLPQALYDNDPLADAYRIEDAELGTLEVYPARRAGQLTATAFQVSTVGYGGPIVQLIALDNEGRILGVRVLSHKETPGLADKIEIARSDWIKGFDGLSLANTAPDRWAVKKDGGQFDQFAGATITPRAIVKGVVRTLEFQARQSAVQSNQETRP